MTNPKIKSIGVMWLMFLGFSLGSISTQAQFNLVPNPGFEYVVGGCTYYTYNAYNNSQPWERVPIAAGGLQSNPDVYITDCLQHTGTPNRPPYQGKNQGGLYLNRQTAYGDYREYMQVKLEYPLEAGETYYFSVHHRQDPCSNVSPAGGYGNHLGFHFSQEPLNQPFLSADPFKNGAAILLDPTLIITEVHTSKKWEHFGACFEAEGGEEYLTIGNFMNCMDFISEPECAAINTAYANIDEVRLYKSSDIDLSVVTRLENRNYGPGVFPPIHSSPGPFYIGYDVNPNTTNGNVIVQSGARAIFRSGTNVILKPGFHAKDYTSVYVDPLSDCSGGLFDDEPCCEGADPIFHDLGQFCEGGVQFEIEGGGTFETTKGPNHLPPGYFNPYSIPNGQISLDNGHFHGDDWEITQTIVNSNGCETVHVYRFDITNCQCILNIEDFEGQPSSSDCRTIDFSGILDLNGEVPIRYSWTITDGNTTQVLIDQHFMSPIINHSIDMDAFQVFMSGTVTVCFHLWLDTPPGEPLRYCFVCTEFELCLPENDSRLDVAEDAKASAFSLSPNPSQGNFVLSGLSPEVVAEVEIVDALGRVVWNKTKVQGEQVNLDLTHVPAGIYLVRIEQAGNTEVLKVMIE